MPDTITNAKFANRYGLNIKVYEYTDGSVPEGDPKLSIDFANVSDIELSGGRVWATGGQDHANMIGFNDRIEGTFKLSTQIMTMELLALLAGKEAELGAVVFQNGDDVMPKYYTINAETVWQGVDGATYSENVTFHKACPQRSYNISYSGDGDPTSVDITFDLMQDGDGKVATFEKLTKA